MTTGATSLDNDYNCSLGLYVPTSVYNWTIAAFFDGSTFEYGRDSVMGEFPWGNNQPNPCGAEYYTNLWRTNSNLWHGQGEKVDRETVYI